MLNKDLEASKALLEIENEFDKLHISVYGKSMITHESNLFKKVRQSLTPSKEVYIIMSPGGGIGLDISTGNGKCYDDLIKAEAALKSQNEWSKPRGRGIYELITLEVINNE